MKFVNFDTAKSLKELGFKEACFGFYFPSGNFSHVYSQWRGSIAEDCVCNYNNYPKDVMGNENIDAPTLDQAMEYLRNIKTLHVYATQNEPGVWVGKIESTLYDMKFEIKTTHHNYYAAIGDAISEAITVLNTTNYGN